MIAGSHELLQATVAYCHELRTDVTSKNKLRGECSNLPLHVESFSLQATNSKSVRTSQKSPVQITI
jgi:hypothetical protein